jgi:hypothetical protein
VAESVAKQSLDIAEMQADSSAPREEREALRRALQRAQDKVVRLCAQSDLVAETMRMLLRPVLSDLRGGDLERARVRLALVLGESVDGGL